MSFCPTLCPILGHWNAYASGSAQVTDFMLHPGTRCVTKHNKKKTYIRVPFWWKRKWNMFTYSICCSTVICLFFHGENRACFGPVVPKQCFDWWSELMAIFCQRNFAKKIRKSNLINLSELVQVRFLMIEKDQSLYNTVI